MALGGSPSSLIRGLALVLLLGTPALDEVESEAIRQMAQWYRSWYPTG